MTGIQDYDSILIAVMVLAGIYLLIGIVWYILLVIANWQIFTKAGEKGWKSIIPFYRDYILFKISWDTKYFWIKLLPLILVFIMSMILSSLLVSASVSGDINNMDAAAIVSLVIVYIVCLVCSCLSGIAEIIQTYNLSKSFGHGFAFTVGLIILNPIFMLILGLGSSQYIGPEGKAQGTTTAE